MVLNLLCIVFNSGNPVATIRNMTNIGSKEIISTMIDKVNMMVDGGELVQVRPNSICQLMIKNVPERYAVSDYLVIGGHSLQPGADA